VVIRAIAEAWRFERDMRAVDRAIPMLPWPRDRLRHQLAVDFAWMGMPSYDRIVLERAMRRGPHLEGSHDV